MCDDTDKIIALLHDVVEDTQYTLEDLKNLGFSDEIIEAVDALSKRSGEAYQDYLNRVAANPRATRVKIADLRHNSDLSRFSDEPDPTIVAKLPKYSKAIEFLENVSPAL